MSESTASRIETEVRRRRTFAIISDPDRRLGEGAQGLAACDVGLDGDRKSSADLLTQRITAHEQTAWMLRSLLEE